MNPNGHTQREELERPSPDLHTRASKDAHPPAAVPWGKGLRYARGHRTARSSASQS